MTKAIQKITLSASRDIPFNKLIISQSNVRRIKAGVSIEELAEDIARRSLLQSLTVRPVLNAAGSETGIYEIPAGGRRYRALELLVKQKRLGKTAPIPCVIRLEGIAEEDSLAENIQRAPLHPLDQFRAFLALREKGQSEEEIAAAFFVSAAVVRQRLRLAAISPKLLDIYAADSMTLEQLMAFSINGDHQRQEQVYERLGQSYSKEPHVIRRMLTEGVVRPRDKRAQFIGIDAYVEAGGEILRDLFQGDDGGWLQDVALVDRLVAEKLDREAATVRAEGWKWVEVSPEFGYGHVYGLRQLRGEEVPLSEEEFSARKAVQVEYEALEKAHAEADELPEGVDQRLAELEAALAAFDERPQAFDAEEIARAGVFVSIDGSGHLRIERGFVRPEDERPVEPEPTVDPEPEMAAAGAMAARADLGDGLVVAEPASASEPEPEEDEGLKPIPDRLITELTTHRTLALRYALGEQPEVAFLAALHALCLKAFYRYFAETCVELDLKSVGFSAQSSGLKDCALAANFDRRHKAWVAALPKETSALWDALTAFDSDSRQALFAHCVSLSVNAIYEPYNRRPRALAHADRLASVLDLDMAATGWRPTVENFLGRVTKARILQAVREAKGEAAARRLEAMRKGEMAETAEGILANSAWLPEPLRTPGRSAVPVQSDPAFDADLPSATTGDAAQEGAQTDDEAQSDAGANADAEAEAEVTTDAEAEPEAEPETDAQADPEGEIDADAEFDDEGEREAEAVAPPETANLSAIAAE